MYIELKNLFEKIFQQRAHSISDLVNLIESDLKNLGLKKNVDYFLVESTYDYFHNIKNPFIFISNEGIKIYTSEYQKIDFNYKKGILIIFNKNLKITSIISYLRAREKYIYVKDISKHLIIKSLFISTLLFLIGKFYFYNFFNLNLLEVIFFGLFGLIYLIIPIFMFFILVLILLLAIILSFEIPITYYWFYINAILLFIFLKERNIENPFTLKKIKKNVFLLFFLTISISGIFFIFYLAGFFKFFNFIPKIHIPIKITLYLNIFITFILLYRFKDKTIDIYTASVLNNLEKLLLLNGKYAYIIITYIIWSLVLVMFIVIISNLFFSIYGSLIFTTFLNKEKSEILLCINNANKCFLVNYRILCKNTYSELINTPNPFEVLIKNREYMVLMNKKDLTYSKGWIIVTNIYRICSYHKFKER